MILGLIGSIFFVAVGIMGSLRPLWVERLVGITPARPDGTSEIRATYGGFFLGLGISGIIFSVPEVYFTIGVACLAAAGTRVFSMPFDKLLTKNNAGGAVIESVTGAVFLLGAYF